MSDFVMVSDDCVRELSAKRYDDATQEALESLGWSIISKEEEEELFEEA